VETVGVGQSELEVAQTADSTAVVLVPESGDGVQAMKAGLMEIGDLFVINKSDRDGADRAAFSIRSALELRAPGSAWSPPVLQTVATEGRGVAEVVEAFEEHLEHMRVHGGFERRRRRRFEQRLDDLLRAHLWQEFRAQVPAAEWAAALDRLESRRATPNGTAAVLIERFGANRPGAARSSG
ncbi:MAG: methylmalonyl Co-A mutase-associated GTPase MeaB, partial [Candidatus Eisenbacteria bacterium]|nr:methylmalonyl Co-A mutase-associated GTPase MeaB [Candidatus Eisenbacteria bacterium]